MSRIGIRPITIKEGVEVEITPSKFMAKAGQNQMEIKIPDSIHVVKEDNQIRVTRKNDSKEARSQHGLIARIVQNLITGVKEGFKRELEFKGTGYRASVNGNELILNMGYSHEIKIEIPAEITVAVQKNTITISGIDKQKVGALAARIRDVRPPEVYKGKGIKYKEEIIKRKAGKKASS